MKLKVRGYTCAVSREEAQRMKELKAQGWTTRQIADLLKRSCGTVSQHTTQKKGKEVEMFKMDNWIKLIV
jgi:DNA-binding NarL/FixJ family response regulator